MNFEQLIITRFFEVFQKFCVVFAKNTLAHIPNFATIGKFTYTGMSFLLI
jgi:hypothetical protein